MPFLQDEGGREDGEQGGRTGDGMVIEEVDLSLPYL